MAPTAGMTKTLGEVVNPVRGARSNQWQGVFLSHDAASWNEGYSVSKPFLRGPKRFLELFAFKGEYQWCVGIGLCTRNKHVWDWNLNKTLLQRETGRKKVSLVSRFLHLFLRRDDQILEAVGADTHYKTSCRFISLTASWRSSIWQPKTKRQATTRHQVLKLSDVSLCFGVLFWLHTCCSCCRGLVLVPNLT